MKSIIKNLCAIATLSVATAANSAVIFESDFSDPSLNQMSFIGSGWSIQNGQLIGSEGHGLAFINGITTPSSFTLEADIRVNTNTFNGHAGMAWGITDLNHFSTAYIRTHSDQVTTWSKPRVSPSAPAEYKPFVDIDLVNNTWYRMSVDVDYLAKEYTVTLGNFFTANLSGSAFDHFITQQDGGIGFIKFNEGVAYDNVRLSVPDAQAVSEPASLALLGLGLAGLGLARRKSKA